jgi:phosphate transport system protein
LVLHTKARQVKHLIDAHARYSNTLILKLLRKFGDVSMSSTLEEVKIEIRGLLESLFKTVTNALKQSMKAFEDFDCNLADSVAAIAGDIEQTHNKTEDLIFNAITTHQPRDIDLRRLVAYLNTSKGLHSVGRFATKIGEIVILSEGLEHFKDLITLPYLSELASAALSISFRAVLDEDLNEIDELEKLEAQSDNESADMFQEIAEHLNHRRDISNIAMLYVIVGRYFERATDQAITIAEAAVYLVTGERKKLGLIYEGIQDITDVALDL